ncbi:MAG: hypothetical protein L3J67_01640 [Hyphomicrobiaceae bacterium]|nr:hypothetical protein [Hyphomicrobiaceae bacterium]
MLDFKHNFPGLFLVLSLALTLLIQGQKPALAEDGPYVSKTVEGKFDEVYLGLKDVITGRGINIAHTLGAAAMLNRTGPAFGIKKNVFLNAETVEFCSAKISHELAAQNPQNVVLCPFTISVYVLTSDPKNVHLTYRIPVGSKGSEQVVSKIVKLIESIIKEATEW